MGGRLRFGINGRLHRNTQAKIASGEKWATNTVKIERANTFADTLTETIKALIDSGIDTPAAIARELNERAIRTPRGAEWGTGQVIRLLRRIKEKNSKE